MKYVVIDDCGSALYTTEHEIKEEAIRDAEIQLSRLTSTDRKRRETFLVLESVNPDEDAENHLDGHIIKRWI